MNAVEAGIGGLVAFRGEGGIGKTRLAEEVTSTRRRPRLVDGVGIGLAGRRRAADVAVAGDPRPARTAPTPRSCSTIRAPRASSNPERFTRFRRGHRRAGRSCRRATGAGGARRRPRDRSGRAALWLASPIRSLRAVPALLVVTCRPMVDVPDGRAGGASPTSSTKARCVELAALDARCARLVARLGRRRRRADRGATELLELSGGNPLLALELADACGADRSRIAWRRDAPDASVGSCLRGSRRFSAEDELVLAAGALLGPGVGDELVASVAAVTRSDARAVRRRGIDAGVLRRTGDGFVFSHGLLRDALLDSIAREQLTRCCTAVRPTRSDALPSPLTIDRLTRVAHHRLSAANPVGRAGRTRPSPPRSTRPAPRPRRSRIGSPTSPRRSCSRLRRRLHARTDRPAPRRLLLELAQMELASGHLTHARDDLRPGTPHADAEADPEVYAEAAIGLGGIWVFEHREPDAVAAFHGALRAALDTRLGVEA